MPLHENFILTKTILNHPIKKKRKQIALTTQNSKNTIIFAHFSLCPTLKDTSSHSLATRFSLEMLEATDFHEIIQH